MKIHKKAVLPKGFKANGINVGLKKRPAADLALIYSVQPCRAAGLFTSNKIQAAPVKVCKEHLNQSDCFRALIVNSGNANCFTGEEGIRKAEAITEFVAQQLDIKKEQVLIASTGIIGRPLPLTKIRQKIPSLIRGLKPQGLEEAAGAIMTTDSFIKTKTVELRIGADSVNITGIAKGAGMISPGLATMLCFILTDAYIALPVLKRALKKAVDKSFNCITVDGCMSTNDTVLILSNACAAGQLIATKHLKEFLKGLEFVCLELARMIVRDAEGATKFIQIKITQARTCAEARHVGLTVANSNLFKTAMFGQSSNFGRIVAALGQSGIDVKEKDLQIKVSPLYRNRVNIEISLRRGKQEAVIYTSDLTPEYVKINARYN
jgi:glutamate N-acetyltransferase/amino-acid N-acetyltransferase